MKYSVIEFAKDETATHEVEGLRKAHETQRLARDRGNNSWVLFSLADLMNANPEELLDYRITDYLNELKNKKYE